MSRQKWQQIFFESCKFNLLQADDIFTFFKELLQDQCLSMLPVRYWTVYIKMLVAELKVQLFLWQEVTFANIFQDKIAMLLLSLFAGMMLQVIDNFSRRWALMGRRAQCCSSTAITSSITPPLNNVCPLSSSWLLLLLPCVVVCNNNNKKL